MRPMAFPDKDSRRSPKLSDGARLTCISKESLLTTFQCSTASYLIPNSICMRCNRTFELTGFKISNCNSALHP